MSEITTLAQFNKALETQPLERQQQLFRMLRGGMMFSDVIHLLDMWIEDDKRQKPVLLP